MRGFILQPTYRIESGRPAVHLYGRLETGEPFLVRDDTLVPHFFIRSADAARARRLGAERLHPTDLRTMKGEPVVRVEVALPADTPPLRDRLTAAGVTTFEADVRFAMRFLIDRGIKGSVEIEPVPPSVRPHEPRRAAAGGAGPAAQQPAPGSAPSPHPGAARLHVYDRPILAPCEWAPPLRVLSFDIETDPRARRLYAIGLYGDGVAEVLYVPPDGSGRGSGSGAARPAGEAGTARNAVDAGGSGAAGGAKDASAGPSPEGGRAGFRATPCRTQADLLRVFCERVAAIDPDVVTGWNVVDFDLRVMERIAGKEGVPLRLGRTGEPLRLRIDESFMRTSRAEIVGRVVLDGIALLKGAFVRLDDYSLETASRAILGEGKLLASKHRAEEIERLYREDLPRFLEYNLTDARLAAEIVKKAGLVSLAVRRSLLTGMPLDRVASSIASFDSLYLPELRRRGLVAPSVGRQEIREATAGGAVLDPVTGLHDNVLVYDYKSLYPSLIRTFNLDPLALAPEGRSAPEDTVRAPNGACFRREPAILPGLLDRLFAERAAARARGDAVASQAIKILMNSFYGVLATPACRFYDPAVANAITHFGQATLLWTKRRAESLGYAVLYGDTDSLFVASGTKDPAEARRRGESLLTALNRDMAAHVEATWGVTSRLELEFERLFLKLFLPAVRHGTAGARKRYAGLTEEDGRETILFTGMEIVRRDWTELAKIFQRGLFERAFHGEELGAFIREFVEELRSGAHDAHLVYRKALRKEVSEYTATTPPHVKAARRMGARSGRLIEYVMTLDGPEPAASRQYPFDYDHYVEKQIRPVAETLLSHLGLSFDALAGLPGSDRDAGGSQLDLFDS